MTKETALFKTSKLTQHQLKSEPVSLTTCYLCFNLIPINSEAPNNDNTASGV
jgi:hypothetical protein